jgi:hypothetical protein
VTRMENQIVTDELTDGECLQERREIKKLADFILQEFPDGITGGSAVDVAIRIMGECRKPAD